MSQSVIGTIPPGGREPPQCVDLLLPGREVSEVSESQSCFKSAENRAASSL